MGMTESAPFGLFVTTPHIRSGNLGLPGLALKLVSTGGKTELRYRGPNITPGYWRALADTAEAFDEESFFKTGDAVRWIDETDIHQGLAFDGRMAEDFKLATGTFVSVGPLSAKIIGAGSPYIQDVVITGLNLNEVGAMVFPIPAVRRLSGLGAAFRCTRCWITRRCLRIAGAHWRVGRSHRFGDRRQHGARRLRWVLSAAPHRSLRWPTGGGASHHGAAHLRHRL